MSQIVQFKKETSMMEIVRDLYRLSRTFCSPDYDKAIAYLSEILPFKVFGYGPEIERDGWMIPPSSQVLEAKILKNGEVIYDGLEHPLRVIVLSTGFQGRVGLEELKKHLHYDKRFDSVVPYHFRQQYRPWERTWGVCVPRSFYDSLVPGEYEVRIVIEEGSGELKVMEYHHKGRSDKTFVFVAHLDHPGMANDDLAGCAVGVEFFRRLSKLETKFGYRLLLVPEIIGSVYYLGEGRHQTGGSIFEAMYIETIGTATPLGLQRSIHGMSNLETSLMQVCQECDVDLRTAGFREIVCNDESVWESYGIPMSSLSRFPYPEYHTDRDNPDILSQESLDEAVEILLKTVEKIEATEFIVKKFKGYLCLSNPKYDLYVDPGQIAFDSSTHVSQKQLRYLMDRIPSLPDVTSVNQLVNESRLSTAQVKRYLEGWSRLGLIDIL